MVPSADADSRALSLVEGTSHSRRSGESRVARNPFERCTCMRLDSASASLARCCGTRCTTPLLTRRARLVSVLVCALVASGAGRTLAQQPVQAPPVLAIHRSPSLALVQPAGGGSVPQDRPAIMFRFAA